jgi:histidyl-tRNA synthetase
MLNNISGFPEFLPRDQIAFNKIVDSIKQQFELCGFIPLDTPAVEKAATLLAKGNDNEIYGLYRLTGEEGTNKKDLALRFDLTIPLARYVAQNYASLTFPYKRYHIAPVWRGERPQAGRYRQLYQADIDIIGDTELPLIYDAEVLAIIYNIFFTIGVANFSIKINNRYILTGLIKSFGISTDNDIAAVMRSIDKVEKISQEKLVADLLSQNLHKDHVMLLLELLNQKMSNSDWLAYLKNLCDEPEFLLGVNELTEVLNYARDFGVDDNYIQIDPSLARGLNYYTGTVFETKLLDHPELGSVCGGGRYANLAGNFTNKKLPGVGLSIGISRLIPKLIETGVIKTARESTATVLVTTQNKHFMPQYIQIAQTLRKAKINTEIYLSDKPLGAQMKYASKKGFYFAIIADTPEFNTKNVIVRDMLKGEQTLISIEELSKHCLLTDKI